jgi:hypothetical protein
MDETEVVLAAHPKVLALVLTVPHLSIGVLSQCEGGAPGLAKGDKSFPTDEVGVHQYESSLIWKDHRPERNLPEEVLRSLQCNSNNLARLARLE